MSKDQLHFRIEPCFYEGKSKSADVARELVRLDGRDVTGSAGWSHQVLAAAGTVNGDGPVRPARPRGACACHRKATTAPAVLAESSHQLGPGLAHARETEVGKLVCGSAVVAGGNLSQDNSTSGRRRGTTPGRLL